MIRWTGRCDVRVPLPDLSDYWFRLRVYDTAAELQAAAAKMCRQSPKEWADTQGVFHGLVKPGSRYLGLMRLCDEHMTQQVVIHEAVHAAAALARAHYGGALDLGADVDMREELLAYAVDDISGSLLRSAVFTERPKEIPRE
ncbi:hypothetical protein [Prescottella equi]|uniref:hypothetical protein n=1 Tax=Rhodococcus hoagii TaxID=43767 RepID=UPI00131E1E79|nr:hypothetical protein [Prescottella equi]